MRRRILITGAGSGIGLATAIRVAEEGAEVLLLGRRETLLELAAARIRSAGGSARVIRADVSSEEDMTRALSGVGRLDVVVANAGICKQARMDDPEARSTWREVLATNLDGVFHTLAASHAAIASGGRVIAVSSGLGKQGRAGYAAYTASKHGVIGLVRALAKEWAPRSICVNAVCPGWVDTEMALADLSRSAIAQRGSSADARREAEGAIPLGRFVTPEEVAELIAWLASPGASAMTGQAMNISGGEVTA